MCFHPRALGDSDFGRISPRLRRAVHHLPLKGSYRIAPFPKCGPHSGTVQQPKFIQPAHEQRVPFMEKALEPVILSAALLWI